LGKESEVGRPRRQAVNTGLRIHLLLLESWAVQATLGALTCSLCPFLFPLCTRYISRLVGQVPPQPEVRVVLLPLSWKRCGRSCVCPAQRCCCKALSQYLSDRRGEDMVVPQQTGLFGVNPSSMSLTCTVWPRVCDLSMVCYILPS